MNCCNRVRGGLAAVSLCLLLAFAHLLRQPDSVWRTGSRRRSRRSRPCFGIGADSRRGLSQPGDNFLLYAR